MDVDESVATLGCARFMEEGYQAQLKSVIMVKNSCLPLKDAKAWVAKREDGSFCTDTSLVARYFGIASDPSEADFAVCFVTGPAGGDGYSASDRESGGTGYVPISLQYEDYTAQDAREESLAGGDPLENFTNRSFRGKSVSCSNADDLEMVRKARVLMGKKPVVTAVSFLNPFVPASLDSLSDALLLLPWVQHQCALDIMSGKVEPSGLLPMQMPADMLTVEQQQEDVPLDMRCYRDTSGNVYDFAFGLDWGGVISDKRVKKYKR